MNALSPWLNQDRLLAWGRAVGATRCAQRQPSRDAWASAARAWDALAGLHSPAERDRRIYAGLGAHCWLCVAHWPFQSG